MPKTRRRPRREAPLGGHIEDFRKEIRDVRNSWRLHMGMNQTKKQ